MSRRIKTLSRRRVEAPMRLRDRRASLEPVLDDPFDMPSEVVDLVTGELAEPGPSTRKKRPGS